MVTCIDQGSWLNFGELPQLSHNKGGAERGLSARVWINILWNCESSICWVTLAQWEVPVEPSSECKHPFLIPEQSRNLNDRLEWTLGGYICTSYTIRVVSSTTKLYHQKLQARFLYPTRLLEHMDTQSCNGKQRDFEVHLDIELTSINYWGVWLMSNC